MLDYTKTIINGVKCWAVGELNRLKSALEKLISAAQSTAAKALEKAETAQNAAESAQTTAESAQTAATQAQSTATAAQSTATAAQTTATNAQTTAQNAQTTAQSAQSTATQAQTTANTANSTANLALPKSGGTVTGELCAKNLVLAGSVNAFRNIKITADSYMDFAKVQFFTDRVALGTDTLTFDTSTSGVLIKGIGDPVSDTGVANKRYVDAVNNAVESKANTADPVFTGSFSQNRKANSTIGDCSHAEGIDTEATGYGAHAEGYMSSATGVYSHAEGFSNAIGGMSHAEGRNCKAEGDNSHAEGQGCISNNFCQHTQGRYNIEETKVYGESLGKYAHIVGNGTSNKARSNAHTLDWNGVAWFQGRPQFGGKAQDDGSQTVMANGDTSVILTSPNGTKYSITVTDDGTLTATEVT